MDGYSIRQLYGGAIEVVLPSRLNSLGEMLPIPDNQEVFSDPQSRASYIIELLQMEHPENDAEAVKSLYEDLIENNQATDSLLIETTRSVLGSHLIKAKMMVNSSWVNLHICIKRLQQHQTDILFYISDPEGLPSDSFSPILQKFDESLEIKDPNLFS